MDLGCDRQNAINALEANAGHVEMAAGLLFQGGFFATPESLKQLEAVEETLGVARKRESRPLAGAASSGLAAGDECCLPA